MKRIVIALALASVPAAAPPPPTLEQRIRDSRPKIACSRPAEPAGRGKDFARRGMTAAAVLPRACGL
jgi:hypothetical protein